MPDPSAQLTLMLQRTLPDAEALLAALRGFGLQQITRCRLTRNRSVMVSFGEGELRVHERRHVASVCGLAGPCCSFRSRCARRPCAAAARHRTPTIHRWRCGSPSVIDCSMRGISPDSYELSRSACRAGCVVGSGSTALPRHMVMSRRSRSGVATCGATAGSRLWKRCCTRWCTSGRMRMACPSTIVEHSE
jgi:hypothetical protein